MQVWWRSGDKLPVGPLDRPWVTLSSPGLTASTHTSWAISAALPLPFWNLEQQILPNPHDLIHKTPISQICTVLQLLTVCFVHNYLIKGDPITHWSSVHRMWVYAHVHMRECVHTLAEARGQHKVFSSVTLHFNFWDTISHWIWSWPFGLDLSVWEPLGSVHMSPCWGYRCSHMPFHYSLNPPPGPALIVFLLVWHWICAHVNSSTITLRLTKPTNVKLFRI